MKNRVECQKKREGWVLSSARESEQPLIKFLKERQKKARKESFTTTVVRNF